ncbi:hypothetical protein ACFVWG_07330 [Kribbella sp. NPDC058245]|uniref:hypothetical protein n=1 Tax=Kribbella sp. NPDC058245 TaxID=3346399 RepID=UPI0036E90096
MRNLTAATAAAVLLTAGLASPAWAEVPPRPTQVRVSWVGDQIRVTWQDQGEANILRVYGGGKAVVLGRPAITDPNEILVSPGIFPEDESTQVSVTSTDADGFEGPRGGSTSFDTRRPYRPEIRQPSMRPDLSVALVWSQEPIVDANPGDPLDRDDATWVKATVTGPGAEQPQHYPMPLDDDLPFDVPAPPQLSTITLSAGNEWGTSPGAGPVRVGITRMDSKILPQQAYNTDFVGDVTLHRYLCACPEDLTPDQDAVEAEVQARPNSAAPWKTIYRNARTPGTPIPMSALSKGSQQYRIFVPAYTTRSWINRPLVVMRPVSSSVKTSLTLALFGKTGFFPASAPVSATTKLIVQLSPQVDMKAALQRWDGKQWRYAREVALAKGHADIAIRAAGRGTTTKYRILTPRVMVKGLPVEASTSSPFTLTVR